MPLIYDRLRCGAMDHVWYPDCLAKIHLGVCVTNRLMA